MPLKGDVKSIELSSIFQMLAFNQKEGALMIKELDGKRRDRSIYFNKSGVTVVFDCREFRRLMDYLIHREELLTSELKEIQTSFADNARGYLEGVRSLGREIEGIGKFIEEDLYDLFFWNKITFEFIEGTLGNEIRGEIFPEHSFFPIDSIVMEAAVRVP